jgi:type IV secretory pathway VirB2 component (pilin)
MINIIKKKVKNVNHWIVGTLVSLPGSCFASSGVTLVSIAENCIDYLTGDLARVTGVAAIVVSGYLFLFQHRIQKSTFISIAAGMGIILGGSTLANELWG